MGTCASSEAQREAMLIDKMMEEELKKASVADEALVKLLILGAGESGKSTLFKQMKLMRGSARRGRRGAAAGAGPRAPAGARAPRPADRRHGTPFTREEQHYMRGGGAAARRGRPRRDAARARRRDVIYENTLVAMQTLAANLPNFDIDIEVVDKAALATVLEADEDATLGGELGERVRRRPAAAAPRDARLPAQLRRAPLARGGDPGHARAPRPPAGPPGTPRRGRWKLRGHVQIVESVVYFFEKIAELKRGDYVATVQDIMRARRRAGRRRPLDRARADTARRHGIVTSKYTIKGKDYEMYDVGGQRNERRKWVNCFENVRAPASLDAGVGDAPPASR
ncbi:hypothetical protein JL720_8879 [Aureococcus anophagefferens]|nr:hypothetical protein JL720_8879 [Aureococcus anophagefferens]